MTGSRARGQDEAPAAQSGDYAVPGEDTVPAPVLPAGRIPTVGMREIVAALHRRRARRRDAVAELRHALERLAGGVERHLERVAQLKAAVEAQGGDLSSLQYYDNVMARLRGELRSAERALAEVFRAAADGVPAGT